jgi:hypothetical protein
MVRGILADVNVEGHLQVLLRVFRQDPWHEFWNYLNLATLAFADVGLLPNATDLVIWQTCQRESLILLTGNRNAQGDDSLEAAIRNYNTPDSLPVITLGTAERVLLERSYAERAAVRMLDYFLEIDRYRGAGRLYAP